VENTIEAQKSASELENEKILEEVRLNLMRNTEEYKFGRMEERERIYGGQIAAFDTSVFDTADRFYDTIAKIIPEKDILQYRLGVDYTTGVPTVLIIVPKKLEDKVELLHLVACDAELITYRNMGYERQFWVTTDESLDQDLINYDFPCFRKKV
jgi:hypothetical protein